MPFKCFWSYMKPSTNALHIFVINSFWIVLRTQAVAKSINKAKEKKIACFRLSARVRFFFPTMRSVNFFRNNKRIKKILNRKRNLKKRNKNGISWKRKMLGHSSLLTFVIYIYKSQIHMFQLKAELHYHFFIIF